MKFQEKISIETILQKLGNIVFWQPETSCEIDLLKVAYFVREENKEDAK